MEEGSVITSAIRPKTLMGRFNGSALNIVEEEDEAESVPQDEYYEQEEEEMPEEETADESD